MRWLTIALLSVGCGDDFSGGAVADAGPEQEDGGFRPTPPDAAEAPRMTPCPTGWREVTDPDDPQLVTCDPWPEGGPVNCAAVDEAHFPGETGCRRIGTACPEGDWAEDLPAVKTVWYVRSGAAGGDGTTGLPFGTIAEAVAAASAGDVVAISKGTFDEVVTVRSALTLWGACVAETRIASSAPSETAATLSLTGTGGAVVQNLQVGGARLGISVYSTAATVRVDSVAVVAASVSGVRSYAGGDLAASDLVVRETLPRERDRGLGRGLDVQNGAHVELTRAVVERNLETGILVMGAGTELVATDVSVRDTRAQERDGWFGHGIDLWDGAHAELTRAAFVGNREVAVLLIVAGTRLVATDLSVTDGTDGHGLAVDDGAYAEISRAVFERNHDAGILVEAAGSELVASDLVVRDTQTRESDSARGRGIEVLLGGHADLTRAAFWRNREISVLVAETGSTIVGTDLSANGTLAEEISGAFGGGLALQEGARGELTRAVFEGNREFGVIVIDEEGQLTATDLSVAGTLEQECATDGCDPFGTGIGAIYGGRIALTRFRTSDNVLCGLQLAEAGEIDLHDGEVSGNVIGANVQTEGFDLSRLQDAVLYVDNETALDTSVLPVPVGVSLP